MDSGGLVKLITPKTGISSFFSGTSTRSSNIISKHRIENTPKILFVVLLGKLLNKTSVSLSDRQAANTSIRSLF